jgi:hypothetical protein
MAPASIYIRFMNTSLLLKWICKLFNEPNGSLWQQFFLKKYLPDGSFIFMSVKKRITALKWFGKDQTLVSVGGSFVVGNGRQVRFWLDVWLGDTTLKIKFPELFLVASDPDISAAKAYDLETHCQDIHFK